MNGILYNYTLFEEVGIPEPSAGNWGIETEFLDAMRALTDPENNQFGFRSSSAMWAFWAGWGRALADGNEELLYYDENAARMTIFDDGAHRAHDLVVNSIWQEGISNKLEDAKFLSGEFSDPFSAGKVGVANFGSAGNFVVRIAGRFDWGINVQPEGPRGEAPIHTSQQPHLVSNAAESNGVLEQTVDMLVFFARSRCSGTSGHRSRIHSRQPRGARQSSDEVGAPAGARPHHPHPDESRRPPALAVGAPELVGVVRWMARRRRPFLHRRSDA